MACDLIPSSEIAFQNYGMYSFIVKEAKLAVSHQAWPQPGISLWQCKKELIQ